MPAAKDLTGLPFGRLTVVARAGSHPKSRKALWLCRCACGAEKIVLGYYLTHGDTRSCGCLHREAATAKGRAKKVDLTGLPFGRLTVLGEAGRAASGDVRWLCRCDCGRTAVITGCFLTRGGWLSCGCLKVELARARARAVGSKKTVRACRTCGKVYEATGPQKDCSEACRLRFHAADEARRRGDRDVTRFRAVAAELEKRMSRGEET